MAPVIVQNFYNAGHTYLLVDQGTSFTWAAAEAHAVSLGGHLATIGSTEEQVFVYNAIKDIGFDISADRGNAAVWAWLGLNDVAVEGTFAWSSGEPVAYTNWYPGQPNGNNIDNQDYSAYFFFTGFDPGGKWFTIPDDDPNNYSLALIELPFLLGTAGNDTILGGIGKDDLAGAGGNDLLLGNSGDDKLTGGDGNDVLNGGEGGDVMTGGAGNDTYHVDALRVAPVDGIVELKNQGLDTVVLHDPTAYVMPTYVENLVALAADGRLVTGNNFANVMKGSAGDDRFSSLGGSDTLNGNAGNDRLDGGSGNDNLSGGTGDDSLFGGTTGRDILSGGTGRDFYVVFGDTDKIIFTSIVEIGKGARADSVGKFDSGNHLIDLRAIDANGSLSGNGAFTFIGTDPFSKDAGELRFSTHFGGSSTQRYMIAEGDVNGDGKADFQLRFDNFVTINPTLTAADFVL